MRRSAMMHDAMMRSAMMDGVHPGLRPA